MKPWLRSRVLYFKARREERIGHFHRWHRKTSDSFGGDSLLCKCGKRIWLESALLRSDPYGDYTRDMLRSMRPMKKEDQEDGIYSLMVP